jgi:hypothetical protein
MPPVRVHSAPGSEAFVQGLTMGKAIGQIEAATAVVRRLLGLEAGAPAKTTTANGDPAPAKRTEKRRARPTQELTKWVANATARRAPTFVMGMTGLDTKAKIIARFGTGATFEKGKPLPPQITVSKAALNASRLKAKAEAPAAQAAAG